MPNVNIVMNSEKNGIEIRFGGKPAVEIIESLKANGLDGVENRKCGMPSSLPKLWLLRTL